MSWWRDLVDAKCRWFMAKPTRRRAPAYHWGLVALIVVLCVTFALEQKALLSVPVLLLVGSTLLPHNMAAAVAATRLRRGAGPDR